MCIVYLEMMACLTKYMIAQFTSADVKINFYHCLLLYYQQFTLWETMLSLYLDKRNGTMINRD